MEVLAVAVELIPHHWVAQGIRQSPHPRREMMVDRVQVDEQGVVAAVLLRLVRLVLEITLVVQAVMDFTHHSLEQIPHMLVVVVVGRSTLAVAQVEQVEAVLVVMMELLLEQMELLILAVVGVAGAQPFLPFQILTAAQAAPVSSFSNTNKSIMQRQFGLSMDQEHGSVQMASMRSIT